HPEEGREVGNRHPPQGLEQSSRAERGIPGSTSSGFLGPCGRRSDDGDCYAGVSLFRKIHATRIPSRYSPIIGSAKTHCVAMSGVGVMTAAMMKMTRTAYLNFDRSQRSETMPSRARKKTRIGISKHRPSPRISLVHIDTYSLIVMTAWNGLPIPIRKFT